MELVLKKISQFILCLCTVAALLTAIPAFANSEIAKKIMPAVLLLLLGDDSDQTDGILTGILIDGESSGVKYRTSSGILGTTNLQGEYQYKEGDTIRFFIGNETKLIGDVDAARIISVLEFENSEQVAVLLQSLDSDRNPNNGIQISELDAQVFSASSITIAEVDADDPEFKDKFEQTMGYSIEQDNTAAIDHAVEEVKLKYLESFNENFIDALNGVVAAPDWLIAKHDVDSFQLNKDVFLNPNYALKTREANLRHYIFTNVIASSMEKEFDILQQEQWNDDFAKAKFQKNAEIFVDLVGLANLLISGNETTEKLLKALKNPDSEVALAEATLISLEFWTPIGSQAIIDGAAEVLPDNSNSRVLKQMFTACSMTIILGDPVDCIAQSGATLAELVHDQLYLTDKIEREKSLNSLRVAYRYLSYYYNFYDANRSDGFENNSIIPLFNHLAQQVDNQVSFITFDQNDVSNFESVLDIIAQSTLGDPEVFGINVVGIAYDMEETKSHIEAYQKIIDQNFLTPILQALEQSDFLATIENDYILPHVTLEAVSDTEYKVCFALENVSSSVLREINVSSITYWLDQTGYKLHDQTIDSLPINARSDEYCTDTIVVPLSDSIFIDDILVHDYNIDFKVQRIQIEQITQEGQANFEVSRDAVVNSAAYPLIKVIAPVYVTEGETFDIDASDTIILDDPDGLNSVFEWEYLPSDNVPTVVYQQFNSSVLKSLNVTAPTLIDGQDFEPIRFKLTVTSLDLKSSEYIIKVFVKASDIVVTPPTIASALNDTGITFGGDYSSGNNSTCTNNMIIGSGPNTGGTLAQDCDHGRDATHNDDSDGHAGFSFTKLDPNGSALANQAADYAATPWFCVQDNVTGLTWEVKTDDGTEQDKDNTYQWGGLTAQGRDHVDRQGDYHDDWNVLVNYANNNALCGYTDWRVPTREELLSIVDYGTYNPAIDTDYFPNTVSSWYWTSSPYASDSNNAWLVYFGNGNGSDVYRNYNGQLRLVR